MGGEICAPEATSVVVDRKTAPLFCSRAEFRLGIVGLDGEMPWSRGCRANKKKQKLERMKMKVKRSVNKRLCIVPLKKQ